MLNTQNIDLVFTHGVDNKTESKNVTGNTPVTADNIRYDKTGAAIPRGGVAETALTSSIVGDTSPAFGALADTKAHLQMSRGSIYRISNDNTATLSGSELRGDVTRRVLGNCNTRRVAVATDGSNLVCTVWGNDNSIVMDIRDASGAVVAQGTSNIGFQAKSIIALYANGTFYVMVQGTQAAVPVFFPLYISVSLGVASAGVVTWTSPTLTNSVRWDICTDGTNIYLFHATNSAASTSIRKFTVSGSTWTTAITIAGPSVAGVAKGLTCLCPSGMTGVSLVVAVGEDAGNAKVAFYNSSLTQVGTTQSATDASRRAQLGTIIQIDSTTIEAWFAGIDSVGTQMVHTSIRATTSTGFSYTRPSIDALPLAHGFISDNRAYQLMDSITEPTYGSQAILEWLRTTGFVADVAFVLGASKNLGNSDLSTEYTLPKVATLADRIFIPSAFIGSTAGLTTSSPSANNIALAAVLTPQTQASVVIITTSEYRTGVIDRLNNQALALAGSPRVYNALRGVGGPWPEMSLKTGTGRLDVDTGTAPINGAGTYSCVFAKVVKFPNGQVYRLYSPIYVANLTTGSIRVTTTALDFFGTGGQGTYEIEFYKTEKNGTVLYLAKTFTSNAAYTDVITDAILVTGRLADVNGDEIPPEIASGARIATQWKDRIALVSADSGTIIKFNKPVQYPIGTCFAPGLEIDVGNTGGNITGLGQMDSPLYIFKRNQIYYIYGDPPGPTGDNGTLNTPILFKDGLGCSSPRSVILTPKGLMFASDKGFYIILRNQEITPVADGPYEYRTETVTGSAIDVEQSEVYFSYEDGAVWVFNYELNAWYKWTPTEDCKGLAMSSNGLVASTQDGFWEYSKDLELDILVDTANQIDTDFRTGWFRMSGIRGFQRARRLYIEAETIQDCNVTIEVYTDYSTTPAQTFNFSPTTSARTQFDLHLAKQKCEAMQFRFITDAVGMKWLGATLSIGVKQGPDKSSSANFK